VSLAGLHILLVDDEPAGREALEHMLSAIGAQVHTANSASEALQLLEHQRFDALIADIAMPDVDGYELIRAIRRAGATRPSSGIYAIALTGFTSLGERDEALAAGYDAHVSKPPNISEIAVRLASGVRAREASLSKA
jgi:CheY-like chemotaxis protein